jgi:hypothetical protein
MRNFLLLQANIAWAFATLNHNPGPDLLEGIAVEAVKKLTEFTAQNISNLLYAFGRLEHLPESFLQHASKAAQPILATFTPQVTICDRRRHCCLSDSECLIWIAM